MKLDLTTEERDVLLRISIVAFETERNRVEHAISHGDTDYRNHYAEILGVLILKIEGRITIEN